MWEKATEYTPYSAVVQKPMDTEASRSLGDAESEIATNETVSEWFRHQTFIALAILESWVPHCASDALEPK